MRRLFALPEKIQKVQKLKKQTNNHKEKTNQARGQIHDAESNAASEGPQMCTLKCMRQTESQKRKQIAEVTNNTNNSGINIQVENVK